MYEKNFKFIIYLNLSILLTIFLNKTVISSLIFFFFSESKEKKIILLLIFTLKILCLFSYT